MDCKIKEDEGFRRVGSRVGNRTSEAEGIVPRRGG